MSSALDTTDKAVEKLKDDKLYYGDYGKQYLSNSDIIYLLKNPTQFRVPQLTTKPMLEGSYFHTLMLEPEKQKDFTIVDVASRSTKAYKELCSPGDILLLQKEADKIQEMARVMQGRLELYDLIYDEGNRFEVPMVTQIMGNAWKGKADIIHKDYIIDIKTSSDIDKFMYSSKTWNYDSQAYIYQRMFNKPMLFIVICKTSNRLGMFDCSADFIKGGQNKVEKATEIYNKFFSDEKTEDINNYIHKQTL